MILCANPKAQYLAHRVEIDEAMRRVLDAGRYILGSETTSFEKEFSDYVGVAHGVGVGSGTEALHIALKACGVGPGDEVITVAHTAVATVSAIELTGAMPVVVDIDPRTYTIDPGKVRARLSHRTKAVIPVHVYGQPAHMDELIALCRGAGVRVIEDCAQAHGAKDQGRRVGSMGDLGCFSFYPTKNLGAIGDGGLVATDDPDLASRVRLLREYGWAERYVSHEAGWNSRLDELQSAILRVKLGHLDEDNARRRRIAARYDAALAGLGLSLPVARPGVDHVYHLYVIRTDAREALRGFLEARGVMPLVHYPVPIHLQPAYLDRLPGAEDMAETERAAREVLSLPMYPELLDSEVDTVIAAVRAFGGE